MSFSRNDSKFVGTKEQVILKGNYGKLRDIEITLWTSDRLEVEAPQLGAGFKAQVGSPEDEAEIKSLTQRLQFVTSGSK